MLTTRPVSTPALIDSASIIVIVAVTNHCNCANPRICCDCLGQCEHCKRRFSGQSRPCYSPSADQPSVWYPLRRVLRHNGWGQPIFQALLHQSRELQPSFSTVLVVRGLPADTTNMHDMLTSAMATASHHLTTREALSGIWGSISLCAWIFLLVSPSYPETHRSGLVAEHPSAIAVRTSIHSIDCHGCQVAEGTASCSYPRHLRATCSAHTRSLSQASRDCSHDP